MSSLMRIPGSLAILVAITATIAAAADRASQTADAWGEPVEGVQLRLALAANSPAPRPGELPTFEVQIWNQGATAIAMAPEALLYGHIEIDGAWYAQTFVGAGTSRPAVIAAGSLGESVRPYQNVSAMFELNALPARMLELRPGSHRIRLRNLTGRFGVHAADGKDIALISNSVIISVPARPVTAELAPPRLNPEDFDVSLAFVMDGVRPEDRPLFKDYPRDGKPVVVSIRQIDGPGVRQIAVKYRGPLGQEQVQSFTQIMLRDDETFWRDDGQLRFSITGDMHRLVLTRFRYLGPLNSWGDSVVYTFEDSAWQPLYSCCGWLS